MRHALRSTLRAHRRFDVVGEAADGEDALRQIERLRPTVVILDIRMPGLDGIATTQKIKERWPSIRVIAHSFAVEASEEILRAGADAFVPKGGRADELIAAVLTES